MSIAKKFAHQPEALKGGAREFAGRAAGSPRVHAEGRGSRAKGNIKQAGAKVKDAFRH